MFTLSVSEVLGIFEMKNRRGSILIGCILKYFDVQLKSKNVFANHFRYKYLFHLFLNVLLSRLIFILMTMCQKHF